MKRGNHRSDPEQKKSLFEAILSLENNNECARFFADLCTPAELEAMVDRWQCVQLLTAGKSYRSIAEETGISITTVTRVARFLNNGFNGYKEVLEKLAR
jgi:TrpR-related protein YerC/YecD